MGAMRAVRRGRQMAERLMIDTWRIDRPTGKMVTNPDFTVTPELVTVYEGKGKLQTFEGHETTVTAAAGTVSVQRSSLHVPVGALRSQPGDIATCVTSLDPLLEGRRFRIVQDYPVKTMATSYRMFVDEAGVDRVEGSEVAP